MIRPSFGNVSSLCERILSSLPLGIFHVYTSYFVDGKPTKPKNAFDYKIILASPFVPDVSFPLYPISNVKELSFLECLLLREVTRHVGTSHSFVLGARFGPRVIRELKGKLPNPCEVLLLKDNDFMERVLKYLLKDLAFASPHYPVFDDALPINSLFSIRVGLRLFMDGWHGEKIEGVEPVDLLTATLHWVVRNVGLGKLLTIPELDTTKRKRDLLLAKQDASRIRLIRSVMKPVWGVRPNIDPRSITVPWVCVPARLFIYGVILDLINAFRKKYAIKLCWNCGKLYYPKRFRKKEQHYCCPKCRKSAETKRLYQNKKNKKNKTNHRE